MKEKYYILTGATGVLGSHLLYELLWQIHQNGYKGKLVLLLRSRNNKKAWERYEELFAPELIPDYIQEVDLVRLKLHHVQLIDVDLSEASRLSTYFKGDIHKYHLVHCAASVNLGNSPSAHEEIKQTNYLGTLNLVLSLMPHLSKVSYISTAFAFRPEELILSNETLDYRNPYEKYKAQVENEVMQLCDQAGIAWQILRPSIICGRLIDAPRLVICRFLVFYLFGAFFYRARQSYPDMPVRIALNPQSGLNIVPVDYAAKAILRAMAQPIRSLNIVSEKPIPNIVAVPCMLEAAGWTNYSFVEEMPNDLNAIEKLYYRTAGAQLSEYLLAPDYHFDMTELRSLMADFQEPDIDQAFPALCAYASEKEFNHVLV